MKKSINKILLNHSSNDLYGASKVLINIVETLISKGYEIHLFLPHNGPLNENSSIKKCRIKIVNLGVFRKKYFNCLGLINRLFFIIKSTLFIRNYILKYNIDLVYINTSTIISPSIAAKITRKPSIYHIHEIPISSKIYTKFLSKIFNFFPAKIISVSESVRNYWIFNGVSNKKIKKIYNGFNFDLKVIKKKSNSKIIFCNISRIIPYKGHLFLIELFYEFSKYRKDFTLNIIGDTLPEYEFYYDILKKKVKEYDLIENIKFLGFKKNVKFYLRKSNFFIHCPINPDPLPTVIFESIENKTPVIYTNLGGANEILNEGKNGLLINENDIENSVKRMISYIDNKSLHKKHVKKSLEYVQLNFNYNIFEKEIFSLIKEISKL